jgi:hypothetical protein
LPSIIPNNGNKATGSRLVTEIGTACVIHQIAISSATAKVYPLSGFSRSILKIKKKINTAGPRNNPIVLLENDLLKIAIYGTCLKK